MDSLTQIILGAAMGEATLGRKVGNRAMIWGAIAGTIPDLDVFANYFMSPIDALAFHRGITHALLTNFILALILGWAVFKLYQYPWHRWVAIVTWSLFGLAIIGFLTLKNGVTILASLLFIVIFAGWIYILYKRYFRNGYETPVASLRGWIWLFLLALITHPILDCFTTYGTQIFLPFSNMRVAFNNISVVDPAYTLPFLVCLLSAASFKRSNPSRRFWNNAGLLLSSVYMVFTIVNKTRVNTIFENSLAMADVQYKRFITVPTIMNNILWYGIAETKDSYVYGMYSFFDTDKKFQLHTKEKDYLSLGDTLNSDKTLHILQWFSDGYFDITKVSDMDYEYTDLRFGNLPIDSDQKDKVAFKFELDRYPNGTFELLKNTQKPKNLDVAKAFHALWDRTLGRTKED